VLVDLGLLLPLLIRDLGGELQPARRVALTLAATMLWEWISNWDWRVLFVVRLLAAGMAGAGLSRHDYWERRNVNFGVWIVGRFALILDSIYEDLLYIC